MITKVHIMILDDRRMKVREIAEAVGAYHILSEELGKKKIIW